MYSVELKSISSTCLFAIHTHIHTHICIYVSVYEYLYIHTHIHILLYIQIRIEQYILEKKILNLIKLNWGWGRENILKTKIQIGL